MSIKVNIWSGWKPGAIKLRMKNKKHISLYTMKRSEIIVSDTSSHKFKIESGYGRSEKTKY